MSKPKQSVFRIGFLADTHFGSKHSPLPPKYRPPNPGPAGMWMDYSWSIWQHFVHECPPLDVLVSNGDELEGAHPTLRSAPDSVDQSPLRQVDIALEALGPLRAKAKKMWLVRGTGFHTGIWYEAIETLGRELNAEKWAERRYSGTVLDGEMGGITFNCVHAQSTGAIYSGTLLNRTAWFATIAEQLGKTIKADVIVRSHTHQFGLAKFSNHWVLSTRAFKLCDEFAQTKLEYFRAQALLDLGATVLTIGPDGMTWKDYAYQPWKPSHRKLA